MTTIIRSFLLISLVLLFFVFGNNSLFGQSSQDYQWYINANAGLTQMYGDVSNSSNPIEKLDQETDFGYGARLGRLISPVFHGHFQYINARFKGYKEASDLEFNTQLNEYQLGTTINLLNLFSENKSRTVNLYGLLGVSVLSFRSQSSRISTGEIVNGFGYENNGAGEKIARELDFAIPIGLGIDFRLTERWFINLEGGFRSTFTDKLDGQEKGSANDPYYYSSLGISYNFKSKEPKQPELVPEEPPVNPFANTYVDLLYFFPQELTSMDAFTMRCKIYKGAVQGKGELTQILPIGFNVTDTVIDGARVEFKNYTLSLYWDELPTDSIFEISYNVQLDKIYGTLPMVSILYLDTLKKEYRYKTDVFIKRKILAEPIVVEEEVPEEEEMESPSERVEFRIQVRAAYKRQISTDSLARVLKINEEINEEKVDNWYKYSIGSFKTYDEARGYRKELVKQSKLRDAFIIAYFDNERLNSLSELKEIAPETLPGGSTKYEENGTCYRVQILALMHKRVAPAVLKDMYQLEDEVNEEIYHNWRKYTVGSCRSKEKALKLRLELIEMGIEGAFIVAYKNGERAKLD